MPSSPSDLAWWAWLLVALGCGVVATIAARIADDSKGSGFFGWLIATLAGLATMLFGIIGVVRLVKWAGTDETPD
jgi:hypothetical protein